MLAPESGNIESVVNLLDESAWAGFNLGNISLDVLFLQLF